MLNRNSPERKKMLAERRERQRNRRPDLDARLRFFSKNSLAEYRKPGYCDRDKNKA